MTPRPPPSRSSSPFHDGEDPANPDHEEDDQGLLNMNPWVLWGLLLPFTAASAWVVFDYAPDSWSLLRKISASVLMGLFAHYLVFINRILVARW